MGYVIVSEGSTQNDLPEVKRRTDGVLTFISLSQTDFTFQTTLQIGLALWDPFPLPVFSTIFFYLVLLGEIPFIINNLFAKY